MNFATLQGLTIPEGVVTQITDASGRVIWAVQNDKPVVLEVEKITSDTYAGETTYTGEQFILLDIYPKTNGTVKVTYGGLTKTITDISGAAEPNAQQVFFGTFNGVSDSVSTPASGELTIEGDCYAVAASKFSSSSKSIIPSSCTCVRRIDSLGVVNDIPGDAFAHMLTNQTALKIPSTVKQIGSGAFSGSTMTSVYLLNGIERIKPAAFASTNLTSVNIPASIKEMGRDESTIGENTMLLLQDPFRECDLDVITIDERNSRYKVDGNCLVEIDTNMVVSGCNNSVIPNYITELMTYCFSGRKSLKSIDIPSSLTVISQGAFYNSGLTSVIIPQWVTQIEPYAFNTESMVKAVFLRTTPPTLSTMAGSEFHANTTIIVPKGCGETYKIAEGWSDYADRIVEAS